MKTPYGSWRSPITSDYIVTTAKSLGQVAVVGTDIYWLEGRPQEGGRSVLLRHTQAGATQELTPGEYNVRTRVHEYGGGAYWVAGETVYFVNFADQRLYRQEIGQEPEPLTPDGVDLRYADGVVDRQRNRIICVREDHRHGHQDAVNTLVAIPLGGTPREGEVLVTGNDFYSTPRISSDGKQLAWLAWNHPNMPWDGTELWVADLDEAGQVSMPRPVAGGPDESVFQPSWSHDNILHFVSDRTGWWNLYALRGGAAVALHEREAEFGLPQWVFGLSTYDYLPDGRLLCSYQEADRQVLALLEPESGALRPLDLPFTFFAYVHSGPDFAAFLAASPTEFTSVVRLDLLSGDFTILATSTNLDVEQGYLSRPEAIAFPTANGQRAHAYFYPPANADFEGPAEELPPLLVFSHGGPTSQTLPTLNLTINYWTSRGFAVVDVNYGGSSGYGRAYRQRLNGQWGVVDVQDCVNAALFLTSQRRVDGERLAIRGGSAGGFTTLCALTFYEQFSAGASYFGVSDISALVQDTHKFESRYIDTLIGPFPRAQALYQERSPLYHLDRLSSPVIFLQGLEDKVVPPQQSESMFRALVQKGVLTAYLPFPGEQHGFRRAENMKRALDAELYFYSVVFGFELAEPVESVPIANLPES